MITRFSSTVLGAKGTPSLSPRAPKPIARPSRFGVLWYPAQRRLEYCGSPCSRPDQNPEDSLRPLTRLASSPMKLTRRTFLVSSLYGSGFIPALPPPIPPTTYPRTSLELWNRGRRGRVEGVCLLACGWSTTSAYRQQQPHHCRCSYVRLRGSIGCSIWHNVGDREAIHLIPKAR